MKESEIIADLSHSYFNHIYREVGPFMEYLDFSTISKISNQKLDSKILERLFFMACIASNDIKMPFDFALTNNDVAANKFKKSDWLVNIDDYFGSDSKQGVVTKTLLFDNFHAALKKSKTPSFDDITYRDFCVGINLNKILDEAPFFVRTLGCFIHENQFHIATEFIEGINLKKFIILKNSTFTDFINIFFQILLGLEIAQNKLNFSHYDLHTDNVILIHQKPNSTFTVKMYDKNFIIKNKYKPVMIDFGLSSIHTKGQTVGQPKLEKKGILPYLSPGYDIYIFLLFCRDIAQNKNLSIFKGIDNLLLFFKTETDLEISMLTNNHIKSLKKGVANLIPNQFIQYCIKNYSRFLNVQIEARQYDTRCFKKQQVFIELKKIFDVNDELEAVYTRPYEKGLVKCLSENMKMKLLYNKKIYYDSIETANLINVDKTILGNLIHDLNIRVDGLSHKDNEATAPNQTVSTYQKNLFFQSLEYYYIIVKLKLGKQHSFYLQWIDDFESTYTFKNVFIELNNVMCEERLNRSIPCRYRVD